MNRRVFRAGLTALRLLRWANGRLCDALSIPRLNDVEFREGPWCARRDRGDGWDVHTARHVTPDPTKHLRYIGPFVVFNVSWESQTVILRRDAEATGIEAERMVEGAERWRER